MPNKPAMTKLATCYGTGIPAATNRIAVVSRDNKCGRGGRFVVVIVRNGVGESTARFRTEFDALGHAFHLGYNEIVRPVGRPSKGDNAQSKVVSVRFTEADHTALESLANGEGTTVADLIRAAALGLVKA